VVAVEELVSLGVVAVEELVSVLASLDLVAVEMAAGGLLLLDGVWGTATSTRFG